ncbi:MAG: hypothetical protein ACE5EH_01965 [Gammaproteobacteria bacterium]
MPVWSRIVLYVLFSLAIPVKPVLAVSWGDRPQLNQWSVNNGVINVPCPVDSTCSQQVFDDGFFQQKVTDQFGNSFYQHVLTEPGVSGLPYGGTNDPFSSNSLTFSDEHIIRTGVSTLNLGAGDAPRAATHVVSNTFISESKMTSPTLEDRYFQISGQQYTGVRSGGWSNWATQGISQIDWSGAQPEELISSEVRFSGPVQFGMGIGGTPAIDMAISQFVDLGNNGKQGFEYAADANAGGTIHTADPLNPLLPGGTNGGDFSWGAGDAVLSTWVGQYNSAVADLAPNFSYTKYEALTTTGSRTTLIDLVNASPTGPWHPDILALNGYFATPDLFATKPLITADATSASPGINATATVAVPATGVGVSGPPIPYGQWTVNNGDITPSVPCPAGASCGEVTAQKGLLTRQISLGGDTFIQTIITENNATGDPNSPAVFDSSTGDFQVNGFLAFADETFVKMGVSGGIAGKNSLAEVGTVEVPVNSIPTIQTWDPFTSESVINYGWAQGGAADPVMTISNHLDTYTPLGATGLPSTGTAQQNTFDMALYGNGAKDYTMISSNGYNTHYSRTIEGGIQNTSHTPDPLSPLLPNAPPEWALGQSIEKNIYHGLLYLDPTNGGDIGWSPGDTLNFTWVGSWYRATAGTIQNSVTAYTNKTTGERTQLTNRAAPRAPKIQPDGLPLPEPFATPTLLTTPTVIHHPFPE